MIARGLVSPGSRQPGLEVAGMRSARLSGKASWLLRPESFRSRTGRARNGCVIWTNVLSSFVTSSPLSRPR
jgi:hypothetical protein